MRRAPIRSTSVRAEVWPPPKLKCPSLEYRADTCCGHDWLGRVFVLNLVRPVTLWRKVRARLGLHERDTLRSGLFHKPRLVESSTGGRMLRFNGVDDAIRTAPGVLPERT